MKIEKTFAQRVREGWENFMKREAALRELIDQNAESEVIMEQLDAVLSQVFKEVYAEVGFNGEKYDLIMNLEGDWARLFPLTYFQKHAPKEVFQHWNVLVGRQACGEKLSDCEIHMFGEAIGAKDLQVWLEWEESEAKVLVYSEKLLPLLQERSGDAYWICYILLDYALGELAEMRYVGGLEILTAPLEENALTLEQLLPHFINKLSLSKEELCDAERYCELYDAYRMEPVEGADDGLRRDVFAGSSCFVPILNDFWNGETRIIDAFRADGMETGYFCYPLYGFTGENRGEQILDFRDNIVEQLETMLGADSFAYIGGASGIYYGYIDFIAWDLDAVMDAAVSIFEKSGIDWAMYHSFRQDADGVTLFEK